MSIPPEGMSSEWSRERSYSNDRLGREVRSFAGDLLAIPGRATKFAFDQTLRALEPDVATHLVQSGREALLAARSFIDYEIRMVDRTMDKVQQYRNERLPAQRTPTVPSTLDDIPPIP